MEELTHDFLSFLPAALLALAVAGAPEVYKLAARRFLDRAKSHMASWLYILLDSFLTPVAGLFRVLLGAAAVKSLPFELVRDAVFLQYLNLAADLLVIFYISLGCWRAAPVTRLLLRSAQNHLDLETNQTMGHFFENIFHALVGLFAGIAMLDRLGVPVSGLLTGAGVAGLAVSLAAQSTLNSLIAGITLVPSSKSAFPLGNIASELSGAITCCILVKAMLRCGLGKWKLRPLVTGFLATMASGGVFTFILKIVLGLPLHVWLYAMLPVVAIVGALNGMITFLLFGPVRKLFFVQEDDE